MVAVYVPTSLRRLTGGESRIEAQGATLEALLEYLEQRHPGFRQALVDDEGDLRRFVNVYVNQQEVGDAIGIRTPIANGDEVAFIPAIAGGANSSYPSSPASGTRATSVASSPSPTRRCPYAGSVSSDSRDSPVTRLTISPARTPYTPRSPTGSSPWGR